MKKLVFALFLMCAGCATTQPDASSVRLSMDKAEVLEAAGNPKHTFRANNRDHWVYEYFSGDRELSRVITFSDGKVVKVGKSVSRDTAMKELENTSSMEEFEAKARAIQKSKSKGSFSDR